MAEEDMTLANQLCFSVYHASRLFTRFYQQALQPFELTYPQYLILLSLWENDQQPLHRLGEQLDFGSNTLTPLLRRMEQRGWLTRQLPPSDRRQLIISLTDKGRESRGPILSAVQQCVRQQGFRREQYQQALVINQALVTKLEKMLD